MHALEVHEQKRYEIADLPQRTVHFIQNKKCANCKQSFVIGEGFGIEFAYSTSSVTWWHAPKITGTGRNKSRQQCPE